MNLLVLVLLWASLALAQQHNGNNAPAHAAAHTAAHPGSPIADPSPRATNIPVFKRWATPPQAKVQPGYNQQCTGFTSAVKGDNCTTFASRYDCTLEELLVLNPQLKKDDCETTLLADFYYCIGNGTYPVRPRATPLVKTVHAPATTAEPSAASPKTPCATTDFCWSGFQMAASDHVAEAKAWCTLFIMSDRTITNTNMGELVLTRPGLPQPSLVQTICENPLNPGHTRPAYQYVSSACSCYVWSSVFGQ